MVGPEEYKDTVIWLQKHCDQVEDFTPYFENLNIKSIDELMEIDLNPNKGRRSNKKKWQAYNKVVRIETIKNTKDIHSTLPMAKGRIHFQSDKHYVYDHKISVYYGFSNNIPPEQIASLANLRLITSKENSTKGMRNHIDDLNRFMIANKI